MHFFGTHTCLCRLQHCTSADFGVFKYARAVTQKVSNEAENRVWGSRVLLLRHALPRFRVCGCFVFEFWVLRFRDLGSSFSRFGCFVLRCSFSSASFSKILRFNFRKKKSIKTKHPLGDIQVTQSRSQNWSQWHEGKNPSPVESQFYHF